MKNKQKSNELDPLEILKEQQKKTKQMARKTISEYKSFAIKGNVIDMAIGVVIGSAFTNIVNVLVSSTITPIISLLTNKVDLSTLYITLKGGHHYASIAEAKAAGAIVLSYGELINAVLNFFIISFVLFLVVRFLKHSKKKETTHEAQVKKLTEKKCPFCFSTISIEATRCPFCTSILAEVASTQNTDNVLTDKETLALEKKS